MNRKTKPETEKTQKAIRKPLPKLFIARSKLHGLGVFAGEDIEWGRRIIDFEGQYISKKEVARRWRYYKSVGYFCLLEFGDGSGIDGMVGGNESRFINHSEKPNVAAIREDRRIVFYSLDDIAKNEELTFDYGFDPRSRTTARPLL